MSGELELAVRATERRPIRELQHLLGHKSVRTTEIYLKELIPETVRPNERPMIAGS